MGNSPSNSESEEDLRDEPHQEADEYMEIESSPAGDKDGTGGLIPTLDQLFDSSALRQVASKIKEDMPLDVISQHQTHILRWLDDRQDRREAVVTLQEFCDMLMNKGIAKADAVRAFQLFDTEGEGLAELQTILDEVGSSFFLSKCAEPERSIRKLQATTLVRDVIHIFSSKPLPEHHGTKVLKYLIQNRAPNHALILPVLKGVKNLIDMRMLTLKSTFHNQDISETEEDLLLSGEEIQQVTHCVSSAEVSTNKTDSYRLTDKDVTTYWQSDGTCRSHWIRLRIKHNVVIKQLLMNVAAIDQSYMPQLVSVSVGKSPTSLKEIKEVRIPNHITSDYLLVENLKMYYPIIQINIKRCHSDGCDTRVRGVKALGFKVRSKDAGISVADASAMWFVQVLSTWLSTVLPAEQMLRQRILDRTKSALDHMQPLSLSPVSNERPQFLSKRVLKEVEIFLHDVAFDLQGKLVIDGLEILLRFNLARGSLSGLISTLVNFQKNPDLLWPYSPLIKEIIKSRNIAWDKQAGLLPLTLAGCDGGQMDEKSGPSNVLGVNWNTQVYFSEEGKTRVNMFFRVSDYVQVTKVKIRVVSGVRGPKQGMIFIYKDDSGFDLDRHISRFKIYDKWTKTHFMCKCTHRTEFTDDPVAFFEIEDDWDEIEIPLTWFPEGQFLLVKILEPRHNSAGRLGIHGIRFFGFSKSEAFVSDSVQKLLLPPNKHLLTSDEIQMYILAFLIDLAQVQFIPKKMNRLEILDVDDISLQDIWELFCLYTNKDDYNKSGQIIHLLHCLLPVLIGLEPSQKKIIDKFFKHLCCLLDESPCGKLWKLARQLVLDGAAVFFPDKESRGSRLLSLMDDVGKLVDRPSVTLVFQSLCQFYTTAEPTGLLDLPRSPFDATNFKVRKPLTLLENLITVVYQDFTTVVNTSVMNDQLIPLHRLFSALQTSLLYWCWQQLTSSSKPEKTVAMDIVVRYSISVAEKATEAIKFLLTKSGEKLREILPKLEMLFPSLCVRQLIVLLNFVGDMFDSKTRCTLLQHFKPLALELHHLSFVSPDLFPSLFSDFWPEDDNCVVVLKTWEAESSHNYDNNLHSTQLFHCPGASKFIVEFDSRCETERRYDYLEFRDASGEVVRFDQKVGSKRWPSTAIFSGPQLQFVFKSDSSNTDWGYKFKVIAQGNPDTTLNWPYDMLILVTKLFGQMCGATVAANPAALKENLDASAEDVCSSALWTTIFREGYITKNIQRSLSGNNTSDPCCTVLGVLTDMIGGGENSLGKTLLERCRQHCKTQQIGGQEVDDAITAVFAALLWHNQQLREEMETLVELGVLKTIPDEIHHAYTTAESLRMKLISQRQKNAVKVDESSRDESAMQNPVFECGSKAMFLLKFFGLTKAQLRQEIKKSRLFKKTANKKPFVLNQMKDEKYLSFQLVLEFIQNPDWTCEKVQKMLQQRFEYAQVMIDVYKFMADYISELNNNGNLLQIPIILFLQEYIGYQENFTSHYSEALDGCGLELESKIREAFYRLILNAVVAFRTCPKEHGSWKAFSAYDYIQTYILHLLNVNWRVYDLSFVAEMDLPTLFFQMAKENVITSHCKTEELDEEKELEEYERHMKLLKQDSKKRDFFQWYNQKKGDEKKDLEMFVAKYSDMLEVKVFCNGCQENIPGKRYKCLQCPSLDLCSSCISGSVRLEREHHEHKEDHDIIHLIYTCLRCAGFIMGTRVQCEECDANFCLGCYIKGDLPARHSNTHKVTRIPRVTSKSVPIQMYIHHHAWFLFVALSLTVKEISSQLDSSMDSVYRDRALQLSNTCMTMVLNNLIQVPDQGELNFLGDPRVVDFWDEEVFSTHLHYRILSLLGKMIPEKIDSFSPHDDNSTCSSGYFLDVILNISCGETMHDTNTKHMALGLLGRLLAKCPKKIADKAIESTCVDLPPIMGQSADGQLTINFLFKFGAKCLERSGVEWACAVSRILQELYAQDQWRLVLMDYLMNSVHSITEEPELFSIFVMFVLAGFPEVPSIGTLVSYCVCGDGKKTGVVLKHYADKCKTLLVDTETKKWQRISDEFLECIAEDLEFVEPDYLSVLKNIVKNSSMQIINGEEISLEKMWMLSLAEKALNKMMKMISPLLYKEVCEPELTKCLVKLAIEGTELNKQWLLKDLEVLALMLYPKQDDGACAQFLDSPPLKKNKLFQDENVDDIDSKGASASVLPEENKVWNLLNSTDLLLKTHIPAKVLKNIFEENMSQSSQDLLSSFHERFLETRVSMMKQKSKLTEETHLSSLTTDDTVDTGVQYIQFGQIEDRIITKATEEHSDTYEDLIAASDEVHNDIEHEWKRKSALLLHKEQKQREKSVSRFYLQQIIKAMIILHSRQLLAAVLASWPEDAPAISAEVLGISDGYQIPCILDLLNGMETKEYISKAIKNGTRCCDQETLPSVALMACQFLEEETVMVLTKESQHNYNNNEKVEERIHFPGASYLTVSFDPRCATEEGCDELQFCANKDFKTDVHEVSGMTRSNWTSFQVPGDTLYYKFTSDNENTYWGYKFTVTAGTRDRFNTGYLILHNLLFSKMSNHLPLKEMWARLVHVASKQTYSKRLNATMLLLQILETVFRNCNQPQLTIDLTVLRPLWQLYTSLTKESRELGQIVPPVERALTNLFLVAENLAMEWGIVNEYLVALHNAEDVRKQVALGVHVVAAISLAIGYRNKALDLVMEKPKSKVD